MTDNNHIPIITKKQAQELGLTRYFTGIPCKNGHVAERYNNKNSRCVECEKESYHKHKHKHKARVARYIEQWRVLNADAVKEKRRLYRESTKEQRSIYAKKWRAKNKERCKLLREEWLVKNKERKSYINRQWAKNNPDRMRVAKNARRSRIFKAQGSHTTGDIKKIMEAQGCRCVYCKRKIAFKPKNDDELKANIDHIMPLAKGGSNSPDNLQMLCWKCNFSKGTKCPIEFARQKGLML